MLEKSSTQDAKDSVTCIIMRIGIHISNVMVVDAAGNATRVGRRRGDDGKLVRYSKKTNEELK